MAAATLKQIGERCGLSAQTVGQILNLQRDELFRPETCRLVRETASSLGYRPNRSARSMREGRFGAVTLLLSTDVGRSVFAPQLLDGIQETLSEQDFHLVLTKLPDEKLISDTYVPTSSLVRPAAAHSAAEMSMRVVYRTSTTKPSDKSPRAVFVKKTSTTSLG